jgi:hypothetical protein
MVMVKVTNWSRAMFKRIVITSLFASLLFGCGKKVVSNTSPDRPVQSSQAPVINKKPGEKSDKDKDKDMKAPEKANWLTDSRYQPEKSEPEPGGLPGKPGIGLTVPKPDLDSATQVPPTGSTPPGKTPGSPAKPTIPAGAAPTLPPTNPTQSNPGGGKTVSKDDMKEVWAYIEGRSGATDKMPSPQEVLAALVEAKSPAADLVKSGSIVLTGARTRDSIWAYEKNALTNGGWVASPSGVETLTAAQLMNRLGNR